VRAEEPSPRALRSAALHLARGAVALLPAPARRAVRLRRRDAASTMVSLAELDAVLEQAAEHFAHGEDEGRAFLAGVRVAPPPWPRDPFSARYRTWAFELYSRISGRSSYSVAHESSPFDFDVALCRPFPYVTGSSVVVGDDLVARGSIVRALGLAAPARVVELGPGWGNLTADLAATGHEVTAVDVDEGFCRLIAARVPGAQVVRADMLGFASSYEGPPFDAAVFFESFHHCADHVALLELLHGLVARDGVVVFGAEPVDVLAYPWGPRLDGLSLWSSRRYGWLELGFDERYFTSVLRRTGWAVRRVGGPAPSSTVYLARRAQ
jgi:SAM-dependent methyltransferase